VISKSKFKNLEISKKLRNKDSYKDKNN